MSTIIKRVVDALRAHGNNAEADELQEWMGRFTGNVKSLLDLQQKQAATVHEFIYTVQSRCKHPHWYLCHTNVEGNPATWGPEDQIACVGCGHTLCDERAAKFGRSVMQGQRTLYAHPDNPRLFSLAPDIRKHLGEKLEVKKYGEPEQEALRDAGKRTSEEQASLVGQRD